MRIRWENIFGLLLFGFLIYLFIKLKPFMEVFFEDLKYRVYSPYDRLWHFYFLALLCLTVIAIAKIISRR